MTSQEPLVPANTLLLTPLRQRTTATTVLLVLTCVASVFDAWSDWNNYQVVEDYLAGAPGVGMADLVGADDLSTIAAVLVLITYPLTGAVFLLWLWKARLNAEQIEWDGHRLGRGWTIGGWFCPVVNLWFPYRVVDDIWRVSRPDGVLDPSTPVRRWWFAWIATGVASMWLLRASREEASASMLKEVAVANTVATALQCLAGVFVVLVIRRIADWQAMPRRVSEDTRRA